VPVPQTASRGVGRALELLAGSGPGASEELPVLGYGCHVLAGLGLRRADGEVAMAGRGGAH
jgi:hypothetical protein